MSYATGQTIRTWKTADGILHVKIGRVSGVIVNYRDGSWRLASNARIKTPIKVDEAEAALSELYISLRTWGKV